jgi:hypothetical protein
MADQTTTDARTSAFSVDLRVVTEIDAPAPRVWAILTDTAGHADWNPFITDFTGQIAVGSKLAVTLSLHGRKPMRFTPTVTAHEPGRSFTWLGRVGLPGVFDGAHTFTVEPLDVDRCRLTQSERLNGIAVPFAKGMLTGPTRDGFEALNLALKARAEAEHRG